MRLKRLFDKTKEGFKIRDVIRVLDASPRWKPSQRLVTEALAAGWLSISRGKLVIHGEDGKDLVYRIAWPAGRYCLHCDMKLEDDEKGLKARAHMKAMHADPSGPVVLVGEGGVEFRVKASPDPRHPAGYICDNFYECELEA